MSGTKTHEDRHYLFPQTGIFYYALSEKEKALLPTWVLSKRTFRLRGGTNADFKPKDLGNGKAIKGKWEDVGGSRSAEKPR